MAQIDISTMKRIEKERNTLHDKVVATYTSFERSGKRYVQLDTYGRSDREMPEKISQSIQFDEESARVLVNLLIKEFGFSVR